MTGLNRIPIGQRERSFQKAEDKMGMVAFFDLFPLKKGIQCLYIYKGLKNGNSPDLDKLFVNLVTYCTEIAIKERQSMSHFTHLATSRI